MVSIVFKNYLIEKFDADQTLTESLALEVKVRLTVSSVSTVLAALSEIPSLLPLPPQLPGNPTLSL